MLILKKNGVTEEFDIEKVKISIANSANDIGIIITEADLNMVLQDIKIKLKKLICSSPVISTCELRDIVYLVLKDCGFSRTAESYMSIDI